MSVPNKRTKRGAIVTGLAALVGTVAVVAAFVANASPYGTFADARNLRSDSVHVAGDIDKSTVRNDLEGGVMSFEMKDAAGERMTVVYSGPPPENLSSLTKVVAIGGVKNGRFYSDRLLVKCPSKYAGTKSS